MFCSVMRIFLSTLFFHFAKGQLNIRTDGSTVTLSANVVLTCQDSSSPRRSISFSFKSTTDTVFNIIGSCDLILPGCILLDATKHSIQKDVTNAAFNEYNATLKSLAVSSYGCYRCQDFSNTSVYSELCIPYKANLTEKCGSIIECYDSNAECKDTICQCKTSFEADKGICTVKPPGPDEDVCDWYCWVAVALIVIYALLVFIVIIIYIWATCNKVVVGLDIELVGQYDPHLADGSSQIYKNIRQEVEQEMNSRMANSDLASSYLGVYDITFKAESMKCRVTLRFTEANFYKDGRLTTIDGNATCQALVASLQTEPSTLIKTMAVPHLVGLDIKLWGQYDPQLADRGSRIYKNKRRGVEQEMNSRMANSDLAGSYHGVDDVTFKAESMKCRVTLRFKVANFCKDGRLTTIDGNTTCQALVASLQTEPSTLIQTVFIVGVPPLQWVMFFISIILYLIAGWALFMILYLIKCIEEAEWWCILLVALTLYGSLVSGIAKICVACTAKVVGLDMELVGQYDPQLADRGSEIYKNKRREVEQEMCSRMANSDLAGSYHGVDDVTFKEESMKCCVTLRFSEAKFYKDGRLTTIDENATIQALVAYLQTNPSTLIKTASIVGVPQRNPGQLLRKLLRCERKPGQLLRKLFCCGPMDDKELKELAYVLFVIIITIPWPFGLSMLVLCCCCKKGPFAQTVKMFCCHNDPKELPHGQRTGHSDAERGRAAQSTKPKDKHQAALIDKSSRNVHEQPRDSGAVSRTDIELTDANNGQDKPIMRPQPPPPLLGKSHNDKGRAEPHNTNTRGLSINYDDPNMPQSGVRKFSLPPISTGFQEESDRKKKKKKTEGNDRGRIEAD